MIRITALTLLLLTTFFDPFIAGAAPGDLDGSFGSGGVVTTDFGVACSNHARAIRVQADAKLVVAGTAPRSGGVGCDEIWLVRYNSNGSIDTTFGSQGTVATGLLDTSGGAAEGVGLVVLPDGKLLVGATVEDGLGGLDFAIARYNANGAPDATFGTGGRVTTNFVVDIFNRRSNEGVSAIALQPDGAFVAVGEVTPFGSARSLFGVVRYLSNGDLDSSFGTGGLVITDFQSAGDEGASTVVLQSDGKIVVGGTTDRKFALVRYTSVGVPDPAFGVNGLVTTSFAAGGNVLNALVLQPDGKLVAGGSAGISQISVRFGLARYLADGAIDEGFGVNGTNIIEHDHPTVLRALVLQPDAKLVAAGGPGGSFAVGFDLARLDQTGTLDPSFGVGGTVNGNFNLGGGAVAFAAALQSDGKLVATGTGCDAQSNCPWWVLARYETGVPPPPPPDPILSVTPPSLDFGPVELGSSRDMDFTVQNTGGGALSGSASTSTPFSMSSGSPFNLTAGQSQAVTVRFSPTVEGSVTRNVIFTSNGGDSSRPVTGQGVLSPTLTVALATNPTGGTPPLTGVDLTATVGGTATGTINYTFYCDRMDSGTNITPGWAAKFDGITENPKTAVDACSYQTVGTYTAKVIAERGTQAAEARAVITVGSSPTLTVTLGATPPSGPAPLNGVDLTATVGGTATGTINYTFYCDRMDSGTNITPGWAAKFDGILETPKTAFDACSFTTPGTYTAKVIVERGSLAAQARTTLTVGQPLPGVDLVVDDLDVTLTASGATVRFKIRNLGTLSAGASTARVRLAASDADVKPCDPLLKSLGTPGIPPGSSVSFTHQVNITPGSYVVWVIADADGQISQTDTSNDRAHRAVTRTVTPVQSTVAHGFDFPLRSADGTFLLTEAPGDDDCWRVDQDFGSRNPDAGNRYHLGEDWNRTDGRDEGQPVYAVADGKVVFVSQDAGCGTTFCWEGVVIIRHDAPPDGFRLPDGSVQRTPVTSFYGHLRLDTIRVRKDDLVRRNQQIGVIGPTPLGSTGPHLHFEVRTNANEQRGAGYSDTDPRTSGSGWTDPTSFILSNQAAERPPDVSMTAIVENSRLVPGTPTVATFSWAALPGATQYGFEFTGPNLQFTNPNGTTPDSVNGFGGAGGAFIVPSFTVTTTARQGSGTGLDASATEILLNVTIPPTVSPGAYQVRVIGLSDTLRAIGTFSDPITVLLGNVVTIGMPGGVSQLQRGTPAAFAWNAVLGAFRYFFEFTGADMAFGNPNATAPDPVNGCGGGGGCFSVPQTGFNIVIPLNIPPGRYQVRVMGTGANGLPVGGFTDAVTVVVE